MLEKVKQKFNLLFKSCVLESKQQKLQLIELLLLITTLSATFNLEKSWIWFYMFFALLSIVYFLVIQNPNQSDAQKKNISFISFFIGLFSSALLTGNLFISLPKAILSQTYSLIYSVIFLVTFIVYYLFFTVVLWKALKND